MAETSWRSAGQSQQRHPAWRPVTAAGNCRRAYRLAMARAVMPQVFPKPRQVLANERFRLIRPCVVGRGAGDRIAEPWGPGAPYGPGAAWPVRVDTFLEDGVEPERVEAWVPSACVLLRDLQDLYLMVTECDTDLAAPQALVVARLGATMTVEGERPKGIPGRLTDRTRVQPLQRRRRPPRRHPGRRGRHRHVRAAGRAQRARGRVTLARVGAAALSVALVALTLPPLRTSHPRPGRPPCWSASGYSTSQASSPGSWPASCCSPPSPGR